LLLEQYESSIYDEYSIEGEDEGVSIKLQSISTTIHVQIDT